VITIPPAYITQRPFIPWFGNKVANNLNLDLIGYPIINHRDNQYLCCDGQHRIYGLRTFGFGPDDTIECEVYEDLTDEEMAELFLGRDQRRAVAPFYKFHIGCTAGYVRELAVRRVVEAHGLTITRARKENSIGAVSTLLGIYDTSTHKDVAVGWVVRVAKHAFGGDASGFDALMLDALGAIYNRYFGRLLIEKDMIDRLGAVTRGVRGITQRSEALRHRTGSPKIGCLAAIIVDIYNKPITNRPLRLPPWFKDVSVAAA
jgi:hypothetical protein